MKRREFTVAGGLLMVGFAGCLGNDEDSPPERPWPESETVDDPDGVHDLFIENHMDTTEAAWVRVVRDDGARVVDGRYELPDRRGIEFEDVAAWETTYTVEVAIDGEPVRSVEWYTEACGTGSESDGGSRDAGVRVLPAEGDGDDEGDVGEHRLEFKMNQCDAVGFANSLPAGPAASFRLDE